MTSQNETIAKSPFAEEYPFYMLIEVASKQDPGSDNKNSDLDRLFQLIESADSHILDGVVAQDQK